MTRPAAGGDWDRMVRRPEERCAECDRPLASGVEIISALVWSEGEFHRRDHHADCPPSEEADSFSFWRWKKAAAGQASRRLDIGFLTEFFKRLADSEEPQQAGVRWIVALLLMRKKVLELVGREAGDDGREVLQLRIKKAERVFAVADPGLDEQAMLAIHEDLGRLFEVDPAAPADTTPAPQGGATEGTQSGSEAASET